MTGNKQGTRAQGNELKTKPHHLADKPAKNMQQNDQQKGPTKQTPSRSKWTGDL